MGKKNTRDAMMMAILAGSKPQSTDRKVPTASTGKPIVVVAAKRDPKTDSTPVVVTKQPAPAPQPKAEPQEDKTLAVVAGPDRLNLLISLANAHDKQSADANRVCFVLRDDRRVECRIIMLAHEDGSGNSWNWEACVVGSDSDLFEAHQRIAGYYRTDSHEGFIVVKAKSSDGDEQGTSDDEPATEPTDQ